MEENQQNGHSTGAMEETGLTWGYVSDGGERWMESTKVREQRKCRPGMRTAEACGGPHVHARRKL